MSSRASTAWRVLSMVLCALLALALQPRFVPTDRDLFESSAPAKDDESGDKEAEEAPLEDREAATKLLVSYAPAGSSHASSSCTRAMPRTVRPAPRAPLRP